MFAGIRRLPRNQFTLVHKIYGTKQQSEQPQKKNSTDFGCSCKRHFGTRRVSTYTNSTLGATVEIGGKHFLINLICMCR